MSRQHMRYTLSGEDSKGDRGLCSGADLQALREGEQQPPSGQPRAAGSRRAPYLDVFFEASPFRASPISDAAGRRRRSRHVPRGFPSRELARVGTACDPGPREGEVQRWRPPGRGRESARTPKGETRMFGLLRRPEVKDVAGGGAGSRGSPSVAAETGAGRQHADADSAPLAASGGRWRLLRRWRRCGLAWFSGSLGFAM